MIVSFHSEVHIFIRIYETFKLSTNQDYIFEFKSDLFIFYIYVMNVSLSFAHTINISKKSVIILQKMQVKIMTECDFTNVCHMNADAQALILIKLNFIQSSILTEFSNSNLIRIKIVSTKEIIFYDTL